MREESVGHGYWMTDRKGKIIKMMFEISWESHDSMIAQNPFRITGY